jgi:hypothetical protein
MDSDDDDDDDVMVDDDEAESHDDDDDDDNDDNDEEDTGSVNEEILVPLEEFMHTFHNGVYDQEFDNALSFDRGAISPDIRPTQESYNKPDNWRERNRIGLTNLKRQLQDCIDSVTPDLSDSFDLRLDTNINWRLIRGQQLLMDNEEPIVWHEPVLDEYWNKLEAKIFLRASKIKRMYIENVEMKKERLATLVPILISGIATNSCYSVRFDNANLCEEGIVWLSKLVDASSKLQVLHLHRNWIDNMDSARCLSRSLKSHACIDQLYLCHCDLGSSPEILMIILQSDVRSINLSNNNIDSLGAVTVAEYLERNPPIEALFLYHNHLNDNDVIFISRALKRNTNLKTIIMHSNDFTSIGVKALLTCVFDSSSLNAISESNHTLSTIEIVHCRYVNGFIDRLLELNQTQKIIFALQDKDSLLQYLANVPVELIPEVLAFPHGQFDNQPLHKHLNIVYSTMRWWNMPMLYSYHQCVKSDTTRERDDMRN